LKTEKNPPPNDGIIPIKSEFAVSDKAVNAEIMHTKKVGRFLHQVGEPFIRGWRFCRFWNWFHKVYFDFLPGSRPAVVLGAVQAVSQLLNVSIPGMLLKSKMSSQTPSSTATEFPWN